MRQRRETAEHPVATLKMRMGATHFLMKRLPKVATEMALHVLDDNLTRVINIIGVRPLLAVMRTSSPPLRFSSLKQSAETHCLQIRSLAERNGSKIRRNTNRR